MSCARAPTQALHSVAIDRDIDRQRSHNDEAAQFWVDITDHVGRFDAEFFQISQRC